MKGWCSEDSWPPSCLFHDLLQDGSLFPDCHAWLGCFDHYLSEARVEVDRGNFSFYGNDFSNVRLGLSFWKPYGLVRSDDDSLMKEVNDLRHNIVLFSEQTDVLYVDRKSWPFEFYTSYLVLWHFPVSFLRDYGNIEAVAACRISLHCGIDCSDNYGNRLLHVH